MDSTTLGERTFRLPPQTIDVWPVHVGSSEAITARLLPLLAPDEAGRSLRFHFDHLRHSFILSRGILRIVLGRYLGTGYNEVQFNYGPKGKPNVAAPVDIRFNVAHSGAIALFAFTIGCEIGIDAEQVRPLQDIHEIASRFFCSEEAAELRSLPAEERERAFFLCWTRKEAYIKAVGSGLSMPLDSFRVSLQLNAPARFIHIRKATNVGKTWILHNIELGAQYAAALAYMAPRRDINVLPFIQPTQLLDLLEL